VDQARLGLAATEVESEETASVQRSSTCRPVTADLWSSASLHSQPGRVTQSATALLP
jgi:hypothetical protein